MLSRRMVEFRRVVSSVNTASRFARPTGLRQSYGRPPEVGLAPASAHLALRSAAKVQVWSVARAGISHPAEPYDQPARPLRARKPVSASQSPEIKPRKTPLGGTLSEVQRLLNADPSNEWVDFRSRGRPISQREIALLLVSRSQNRARL